MQGEQAVKAVEVPGPLGNELDPLAGQALGILRFWRWDGHLATDAGITD